MVRDHAPPPSKKVRSEGCPEVDQHPSPPPPGGPSANKGKGLDAVPPSPSPQGPSAAKGKVLTLAPPVLTVPMAPPKESGTKKKGHAASSSSRAPVDEHCSLAGLFQPLESANSRETWVPCGDLMKKGYPPQKSLRGSPDMCMRLLDGIIPPADRSIVPTELHQIEGFLRSHFERVALVRSHTFIS